MDYKSWILRERKIRSRLLTQYHEQEKNQNLRICTNCDEILMCYEKICPNCGQNKIRKIKYKHDEFLCAIKNRIRCIDRFDRVKRESSLDEG
jgi:hypothetical protein